MKKILALMLLVAFGLLEAQSVRINGQTNVKASAITWTIGSNAPKMRHRFYTGNVYVDTSADGVSGAWKRVDNTADSCSNPFLIVTDSTGGGRPVWEYRLLEKVRAVNASSNAHVYRVQTRELFWSSTNQPRWTGWTKKGINNGYQDVTVQDSLLVANTGTTSATWSYALGMFLGMQARLCPDEAPGTSTSAGDSVIVDSIFVFTR